jgi:hypothetical protein
MADNPQNGGEIVSIRSALQIQAIENCMAQ